ncbi:MAG: hypothetical protein KAJ55_16055 [Anaerolineales bacterium]|nr:hypothetical protein [Anaerolineales bacterium]
MIVEGIKIIRRRGVEERQAPRSSGDPWADAEAAIHKDLKRQGMWARYRAGQGEFEPAFFCASDDYLLLQEMANDPHLRFWYGEKTKRGWRSFWDEHGNQWVKVVPHPQADHAHVADKQERWGDQRVNLTEGEQAEIKRRSGGNRLKEEELSMDFRSPSRFGWDDLGFHTVSYDLPNFPENVEHWLDGTWDRYDRFKEQLIHRMYEMVRAHKAEGDNRTKEVKAQRKKEQELMLNTIWKKFWKWWMDAQGRAKARAEDLAAANSGVEIDGVPINFIVQTDLPLTKKQVNSLKRIIEVFRLEMGFETPVMRFWAGTKCTKCDAEARMLLPMDAEVAFCKLCGTMNAQVTEYEYIPILNERPMTDWWELAERLRRQIAGKYAEGAEIEEISRLERRLHFIEVEHIKLVDANNLFYSGPAIDDRFV